MTCYKLRGRQLNTSVSIKLQFTFPCRSRIPPHTEKTITVIILGMDQGTRTLNHHYNEVVIWMYST